MMKGECNWGMALAALVLITLGIYCLVAGFITQTSSVFALDIYAMGYYLVGLAFLGLGKKFKFKAMGMCMEMMHKR